MIARGERDDAGVGPIVRTRETLRHEADTDLLARRGPHAALLGFACHTRMVVRPSGRPDSGRMEREKNNSPDLECYSQRLGYRLRDLRRERGMSQEDVANGAGIAIYTYQKYEKGESKPGTPMNPTYHTLLSLAWVFGLSVTELLDLDGTGADRGPEAD